MQPAKTTPFSHAAMGRSIQDFADSFKSLERERDRFALAIKQTADETNAYNDRLVLYERQRAELTARLVEYETRMRLCQVASASMEQSATRTSWTMNLAQKDVRTLQAQCEAKRRANAADAAEKCADVESTRAHLQQHLDLHRAAASQSGHAVEPDLLRLIDQIGLLKIK